MKRSETRYDTGAIITFVDNVNYGCLIQRWALQRFLDIHGFSFSAYYVVPSFLSAILLSGAVSALRRYARAAVRPFKRLLTGRRPLFEIDKAVLPRNTKWTSRFMAMRIRQERFCRRNVDTCSIYIVGSDQIWRNGDWYPLSLPRRLTYYFLDFVKSPNTKRIAYAASFGKDTLEGAGLAGRKEAIRPLLEKFDAISVREASGVKIIKDTWNLDAAHVLDPTLLLASEDYATLIDTPTCPLSEVKPLFYYMLVPHPSKMAFVGRIAAKLELSADGVCPYTPCTLPPVEQWLKGFRDCEFVVTDSFHGTVFAIINRKPFLVFTNNTLAPSRITTLLCSLGLLERMIREEDIAAFDCSKLGTIDYDAVHAKLDKLREFSGNWLLTQLRKPK